MKEWTLRCGWLEVRVRIGAPADSVPRALQRYRVASRERTAELRDLLLRRVASAVKG